MSGRARCVAWCCLAIATPRLSGQTPVTHKHAIASWLDRYDLAAPAHIIALPGELREASGLAAWNAAQLLSHSDERSTLFLFRVADGKIVREIGIGRRRGLRGDYEDLVLDGRQGYFLRSDGALLEFALDDTSTMVSARQDVSLEAAGCELESLALDVSGPGLVAVCKHERGKQRRNGLLVLRWTPNNGYDARISFRVPWAAFGGDGIDLRFSGSVRTPDGSGWVLVEGVHGRIAELAADGRVIAVRALPKKLLPQVEGVAFGVDGTLYLASEGQRGPGLLAIYPPARR
jgi:uncharacterized protein YjiK